MNIQTLLESANPWRALQDDTSRLAKKWEKSGLLENLSDVERNNMSLLLENQAKQLVVETSQTGTGASFSAGQGEQWAGVALPLVRRIFAEIAAKDFVSVQPMNLPSGLVFFLDFKYGNSKSPFTSGDSLYGNTSASNVDPVGGLYGSGRFGYSVNQFSASATCVSGAVSWADVNFDASFSASAAAGSLRKLLFPTSSLDAKFDTNAVRAFYLVSGSSLSATNQYPAFTRINGANIEFIITGSIQSATSSIATCYYNIQPKDNARGDYEDGSATSTPNAASATSISIPEINVDLRSEPIVAKTRKLKAQWTPEFAQDLNAYQSIDAESELTSMLSEYISMEVDLEILDMLIENANTTDYWSAINNTFINNGATAFEAAASGFYNTQGSWFQTLGTKIQKVSNKIHTKTLRGGANFMVVSPTVATILESIPGYAADTNGDKMEFAMGVQKIGTINSRFKVYKNPYFTENLILMGFRGSQFLETGAVFAPYIPLIMTPLLYDPNTFTPRKGLLTRYAKKMVRPEFYGKIYISGLNTI